MIGGPEIEPSQYFVLDTSSLIKVREVVSVTSLARVQKKLSALVDSGELLFPAEVVDELERHERRHDPILDWVRATRPTATRFCPQYESLRKVLEHPIARLVLDSDKASGSDEAYPHVLALAISLKERAEVTVITEETKDRPGHVSMTTACGVLRLVRVPMEAFLIERKIWPT